MSTVRALSPEPFKSKQNWASREQYSSSSGSGSPPNLAHAETHDCSGLTMPHLSERPDIKFFSAIGVTP